MKCPYCNQNHPDDTKYCPQTGKQIKQQLLSCLNSKCKYFGKHILPLDTHYCPDCGTPMHDIPSGGDISVHDIILGQTTLRELRQKEYEIENDDGQYKIDIDDDSVEVVLFCATYRETEEFGNTLNDPSVLNKDFILNRRKTVSAIYFASFDNDVCNELGLTDDYDEKEEIIEILEDKGYMQIENLMKEDSDDDVLTFVRENKDSKGNTIFLMVFNNYQSIWFMANVVNEWKSYKTGETFYAE